jgi:hypothetical protein
MSQHFRLILAAPKDRQRVRLGFQLAAAGFRPANTHGPWGQYAECWIASGSIWIRWTSRATPPWGHTNVAIVSTTADTPRIACDHRGCLYLVWEDGGDVSVSESHDDGVTWSTPTLMFASGTFPEIHTGTDGTLLAAARVAGELQVSRRSPGDTAWSTPAVAVDDASANMALADDSFGISAGAEGPGRWMLVCTIDGEADISTWFSADDGASWTRFT